MPIKWKTDLSMENTRYSVTKSERSNITGRYILNGKTPVPCPDLMVWAEFMSRHDRRVCLTELSPNTAISTVFLGLDHNFSRGKGKPLLFETMIFVDGIGMDSRRFSTWDEAESFHRLAVSAFELHSELQSFHQIKLLEEPDEHP